MEVENKVSHDGDAHSDDDKMSVEGESELIGILDAGAQYGKIIDRRVRELNVETIILPLATPAEELQSKNFKGLIISGSGASVNDSTLTYDPDIFSLGVPILGICYGYHLIIKHFGGEIGKECNREDGQFEVKLDTSCLLFNELSPDQDVLLTHGDFAKMVTINNIRS
jgi:GMP synthase (glutamine-hydrolysing)